MSIKGRTSPEKFSSRTDNTRNSDARDADYGTQLDPADLLAEYLTAQGAPLATDRSGKLDFGDDQTAEIDHTDSGAGDLTGKINTSQTAGDHDHDHSAAAPAHWPEGADGGAGAPTFSINGSNLHELMHTLYRGNKSWAEEDFTGVTVLTVAFPQSPDDLPDAYSSLFDMPEEEGLDPFEGFSNLQQNNVMRALAGFSEFSNVAFDVVEPGETADFYYVGREYPNGEDDAIIGGISNGVRPEDGSLLRFNTGRPLWDDMQMGGDGYGTILHETGHSLGLSHPGEYDAFDAGGFPTYDNSAEYVEDTFMYTMMSYFSPGETGFSSGGRDWGFQTMRSHDMYVLQQLYGANWSTRDGDTTYGFNASPELSSSEFDFDTLAAGNAFFSAFDPDFVEAGPVFTIWDGGGANDWLDLSGDDNDVMLDLTPGAFSSTHGMTYNISLAHHPADGGDQYGHYIENASGGAGDDTLYGNELANELIGGDGDDEIYGGGGADTLHGGDGDDTLNGGFGNDQLFGGEGHDTADYSYSNVDWTIDLTYAPGQTAANTSGTELMTHIESVITGNGDDHVTGSSVANLLEANGGNDTLLGHDGEDTLFGGEGNDNLDGGSQSDSIYGGDGEDLLYGGSNADYLEGGADDDIVFGGSGGDTIWSDRYAWTNPNDYGDDYVFAGNGADLVSSSGGNDFVDGGNGSDTIFAGLGDDTVRGGRGVDELNGGGGIDEVDFSDISADWHIDLLNESATYSGQGGADEIVNFEHVRTGAGDDNVSGGHGAERFYAGSGNDSVDGWTGDDVIFGEGGRDTLNGGSGDDLISGGTGADTASYSGASSGVIVDLAFNGLVQNTFGAGEDTLISIERLEGSGHGDILSGNDGLNHLHGFAGDDILFGRGGNDWVNGGMGNDILEGGEGNDILIGDDGEDAVSYFFATAGVHVDLSDTGLQNTGGAGSDVISSVENIIGSFHDDWLVGDEGGNRLTGGAGEDILVGGEGADSLNGGDDDDVLVGGAGNDVMDGGAGTDWVFFNTNAPNGVDVDLAKEVQWTKQGSDTIRNVENILGSLQDDDLRGDDAANEIWGGGGDDILVGAGGEDTLKGGTGDDMIYVGNDAPWVGPGGYIPTPKPEPKTEIDTLTFEGFDPEGDPVGEFRLNAEASSGTDLFRVSHQAGSPQAREVSGDVTMATIGGVDVSADHATGDADSFAFNPKGGGGGGGASTGRAVDYEIEKGSGPDVVVFDAGWGDDQVFGFTTGADRLDFSAISALDLIDLDFSDTEDGALIEYRSSSVLLHDVAVSALTDGDFIV